MSTAATPTAPAAAPAAPVLGTPEYDAAMAAKFEAATNPQGTPAAAPTDPSGAPAADPQRPAWLPAKFKTVEDMAKSYTELEKKLGAPKDPAPAPAADPKQIPPKDPAADPATTDAAEAVKSAGLDFDALAQEFAENGDLKPESYSALEKAGIPKPMVDAYVAGQKALAAEYDSKAFAEAGGQENYSKMVQWAQGAMTAQEIEAFNAAVSSGNEGQMKLAVTGLKARYAGANGSNPQLVQGGRQASSDGVYESMAQVTADMKNPLYAKDPAFRAKVERKIAASDNLYTSTAIR